MGRFRKWLKDLLICRLHCDNGSNSSSRHSTNVVVVEAAASGESWRFACRSLRRYEHAAEVDSAWVRSFRADEAADDKEQREHAVAVAEATAAAADAAMVAARAAVALVRLTSQGIGREWRAAVIIQSAFRCHLAKKALRALKALVKIQAMVRGYLVRKRTALTFQSMQALMRAQATMQSIRSPDKNKRIMHPKILVADDDDSDEMTDCTSSISQVPSRLSITRIFHTDRYHVDAFFADEPRKSVTAHNTPRCLSSTCKALTRNSTDVPNYMVGTESFNKKLRCQSTPKQRRPDMESAAVLRTSGGNVC